jgi:hypothetical protein
MPWILSENLYADANEIQPMKEFRETFFGSFEAEQGNAVYPKVADALGHWYK